MEVLGQVQVELASGTIAGIIAVLAGILILIVPRVLNYIVAAYLIIIGLIQIFDVTG